MVDKVDTETRSRMMANVKSKNTKPELKVRSLLHRKGLRFRLHGKDLPGKPDIILPKFKAVIFVNGCFWHGHKNCKLAKLPTTKIEFWENKINKNQLNDEKNIENLIKNKWRVCILWGCAIKGNKVNLETSINTIYEWLHSDSNFIEIENLCL
ncbi:DNA mismatch endonuclease Vsr [Acinetobacter lactucae]|uniref:Very short patch repair endonuclease n=1 Tax=Acinetobacter lactucae TaxID=1785128 RepID=A0A429K3M4_9GAMM|nr:DNA mismatch endonuclease Vsr [Acinetobacter lactucae]RSO58652.1 DNA mismatch endonuclease Vsr [Acinetobacter lactucae]